MDRSTFSAIWFEWLDETNKSFVTSSLNIRNNKSRNFLAKFIASTEFRWIWISSSRLSERNRFKKKPVNSLWKRNICWTGVKQKQKSKSSQHRSTRTIKEIWFGCLFLSFNQYYVNQSYSSAIVRRELWQRGWKASGWERARVGEDGGRMRQRKKQWNSMIANVERKEQTEERKKCWSVRACVVFSQTYAVTLLVTECK